MTLDRSAIASYQELGYAVFRNVLPRAEIDTALAEVETLPTRFSDLIHTDNIRCRWQDHVETGVCLFDTFDPVIDLSPACEKLARDDRVLAVVSALLESRAFLFKDKLILKPPGAKGHGLHQDYIAWPQFPRSFTTVMIPLDSCGLENGCTEVYASCHHKGCLTPQDGDYHPLPDWAVLGVPPTPLAMEPGDIAVFGAFMPHRSGPNRTYGWRRQLYLSYNAESEGGEQRDAHYRLFHDWLRVKYAEYGKNHVYFQ